MTRRELLKYVTERLSPLYGEREALGVAYIVAEHFCSFTRRDAIVEPDAEVVLPDDFDAVMLRLLSYCPVQYVTGWAEFYGRRFHVGSGVLVPRPETEELVAWILKTRRTPCRILDVGTGSGCIAVTLAAELDGSNVCAVDISPDALAYARRNAADVGVSVDFRQADILDEALNQGEFDVIVSNPPYVPCSDAGSMCRNVTDFEPGQALFVPDDDILLFYRAIARFALRSLAPGGELFFEIYENAARLTGDMLSDMGFSDVEIREDINSKPRMIRCRI